MKQNNQENNTKPCQLADSFSFFCDCTPPHPPLQLKEEIYNLWFYEALTGIDSDLIRQSACKEFPVFHCMTSSFLPLHFLLHSNTLLLKLQIFLDFLINNYITNILPGFTKLYPRLLCFRLYLLQNYTAILQITSRPCLDVRSKHSKTMVSKKKEFIKCTVY